MINYFRKDTFTLGIILGLLVPAVLFVIIYYTNQYFEQLANKNFLKTNTIMLVSIVLNVFVLRYFLTHKDRDKTGRGVLMVTFVYAILFFILFLKSF
ncbi:MAG: hypothetical protein K9H84_06125 [Bacteroidales bacterium]|nr:hypothetical protein [Bacteroidales bacterium]